MNEGLEETFYVPLEYYAAWNRAIYAAGLNKFRLRTIGIPNAMPKNSAHWCIQANLRAEELGLPPIENLLERGFKK